MSQEAVLTLTAKMPFSMTCRLSPGRLVKDNVAARESSPPRLGKDALGIIPRDISKEVEIAQGSTFFTHQRSHPSLCDEFDTSGVCCVNDAAHLCN